MKTGCLTLVTALMILILVFALVACGTNTASDSNEKGIDELIVFEQGVNESEGYFYLKTGDKIYVPYCPYKHEYLGNIIGYYNISFDDDDKVDVYEFKGYSSDEWIVDYDSLINEGVVYREINAKDIPEGLSSEYKWNVLEEETIAE